MKKSFQRIAHQIMFPGTKVPAHLEEKQLATTATPQPLVTVQASLANDAVLAAGRGIFAFLGGPGTIPEGNSRTRTIALSPGETRERVMRGDLSTPILMLSPRDCYALEDFYSGVFVTGGTGSGKTSTSGQLFAKASLRAGMGALVLCAKDDEAALWEGWTAQCGRSADVVRVCEESLNTDNPTIFDFVTEELTRPTRGAGLIENLVSIISTIMEVASRKNGNNKGDDFFERAAKQLMRNCIQILGLGEGRVSIRSILQVAASAPKTASLIEDPQWQAASRCYQALLRAREVVRLPREEGGRPHLLADVEMAEDYLLSEFPNMADKTRSSITATVSALLDSFGRYPLRELFGSGEATATSTVRPSDAWLDGKILIIDLSIKNYNETGQYAQAVWKYCFQKGIEQRGQTGRPCLLYCDEAQYFAVKYDQLFATTARSSRCATVYLTQNISNFYTEMGGDMSGKAAVDSLLGNLQTRLYHQNLDNEQNEWASRSVGQVTKLMFNFGFNPSNPFAENAQAPITGGASQQIQADVQPREFTLLRTGGIRNNLMVDAIAVVKGRKFANGKTWTKVTFNQKQIADS